MHSKYEGVCACVRSHLRVGRDAEQHGYASNLRETTNHAVTRTSNREEGAKGPACEGIGLWTQLDARYTRILIAYS